MFCIKDYVFQIINDTLIPGNVVIGIFSVINRHPFTGSQNSLEHFGRHLPPHLFPKLPGGQDVLQNSPKKPGLHAAKYFFKIQSTIAI